MKEVMGNWSANKQNVIHDLNGSVANIRSSIQTLRTDPLIAETLLKDTLTTITKLLLRIGQTGNEKE